MKHIRQTNWKYKYMYIHTREYPNIVLIRYAITPTGRSSKYWATITQYGKKTEDTPEEELLKLANKMRLPKLPTGYTWSDVYIYH